MFINKVTLYSGHLTEMKDFYEKTLGFEILADDNDAFSVQAGDSVLQFKKAPADTQPFYHFAFNIPPNHFNQAKKWAKDRVILHKEDGDDEVYFHFLDANAFYFSDPAGNVVELIARHSVFPDFKKKRESFSANSILNIGEINLTTRKVADAAAKLNQSGILVRDNEPLEPDGLNFMGEMTGGSFLLLGPPQRRWFFSNKYAEAHPVSVQVDGEKQIFLDEDTLKVETIK
ncbi:VOC family protein [Sediminibacillus albus]|nr:VOC family protein [Sediminibacillus albus]